ncbi:PhzF family phenazine biosynthesis protein [Spongiimicrobium salis]|uniref:PhzF family phenazine biosynthesis protein n=1 Tax=Spongiimicrobium salis TaxID=1667022 RepID=UPI00374D641C
METYLVDSFTDTLFKGNPAGVCILKRAITDEQMLAIAQELGLSETAFIKATGQENTFSIRFFSPKMEIPLCGHATLAAAKILFEKNSSIDHIHFTNIQHLDLKIEKKADKIKMLFPIYTTVPMLASKSLLRALGLSEILHSAYNKETKILLLEISDNQVLRNMTPNFEALVRSHDALNGVLVTTKSDQKEYDFESRYFWPWSGTPEDPVTGATHTFLAPYWAKRLHKSKMKSFQCSERTGFMDVELKDDTTLIISGTAKIVLEGTLNL